VSTLKKKKSSALKSVAKSKRKKTKGKYDWWKKDEVYTTPAGKFITEGDRVRTAPKKKKQKEVYSSGNDWRDSFGGSGGTK